MNKTQQIPPFCKLNKYHHFANVIQTSDTRGWNNVDICYSKIFKTHQRYFNLLCKLGSVCVDINEIVIFYKKPLPTKKTSPKKTFRISRKIAHRSNINATNLNIVSWVLIMCLFKLSFLLNLPSQILQASFLRMFLTSLCLLYVSSSYPVRKNWSYIMSS